MQWLEDIVTSLGDNSRWEAVVSVPADASVHDAVLRMARNRVKVLVVRPAGSPEPPALHPVDMVGIVTQADV